MVNYRVYRGSGRLYNFWYVSKSFGSTNNKIGDYMDTVGFGLSALGRALTALCVSGYVTALGVIAALTFLIYEGKITLEQFKDFITKKDRWHR